MIAGQADHPEVVGINGYCDNSAIVVQHASRIEHMNLPSPLFLVAQTTFVPKEYEEIQCILRQKNIAYQSLDSICQATVTRQKEAEILSKRCDAMINSWW